MRFRRLIVLAVLAALAVPGGAARADVREGIVDTAQGEAFRWRWLTLRPFLTVQTAGFAEANAGFDGTWAVGPVADSRLYFEHADTFGFEARADLADAGALRARLSAVYSMTGGGLDASASNAADPDTQAWGLEDASLAWTSGDLFPAVGRDALQISAGNQRYQVFDGLLFWIGASNGGRRGADWIAPRKAFHETGLVRLQGGAWTVDAFHLGFDDEPDTGTRLAGGRIERAFGGATVPAATLGLSYFNLYASRTRSRDGLNVLYAYGEVTPLERVPELTAQASLVAQSNSEVAGLSDAIGFALSPSYAFASLPWSPRLTYRYASFGGGERRAFDPLFGGLSEWGTWFQGELLGEFVLPNSNVDSHMVRLQVSPHDAVDVFLLYFKFLLSDRFQTFGAEPRRVGSSALADEVDLVLQVRPSSWWSAVVQVDVAVPDDAFRQAVGGSATWLSSMAYLRLHF